MLTDIHVKGSFFKNVFVYCIVVFYSVLFFVSLSFELNLLFYEYAYKVFSVLRLFA